MSQLSYSAATMLTPKADSSLSSSLGAAAVADYPSIEEKHDHLINNSFSSSFNYPATLQGSYGVNNIASMSGIHSVNNIASMSGSYGVNNIASMSGSYGASHDVKEDDEEEEEDEEDYDEDEDYDDGFDGDDYGDYETPSAGTMSESLMIALGLDVTNRPKVESDWIPPSNFGLDYSARKLYILLSNTMWVHCIPLYM